MRIAVLSHSCVVGVNQLLFQSLSRIPDTEVLIVSPSAWVNELTNVPSEPQELPDPLFTMVRRPVAFVGKIAMHFYPQFPDAEIKAFAPDVIYSTQEPYALSNYQALLLAKRMKKPFVCCINQNILKTYPPPFSWVEAAALRDADYILSCSQEGIDLMTQKKRTRPSVIVPFGIDVSLFFPSRADKEAVRASLGIGADDIVFGYLGRLVPEKGAADMLDALPRVIADAPVLAARLKILIVGAGVEEANLRAQAAALGITDRVVFAGAVPHREAGRYMNAFDVFVIPSRTMPNWKEQFGRVIVEALACEVPVIGSDSGEIPHLTRAIDGGLIFREHDVADLAAKMTQLASDRELRTRIGRRGAKAVAEGYTTDAVAARLRALLAEAIRARDSGRAAT